MFGQLIQSVPTPFGSFTIGELSYSYYRMFIFLVALFMIASLWAVFRFTRFGVRARATMEDPRTARALGVDTARIYALTFGLGTMLAGLSGGLLALTSTIGPFYGMTYTPQAFITVVVGGGAEIVTGLLASVLSLGAVKTIFMNQFNILLGHVAMLVLAFVIIRLSCRPASPIGSRDAKSGSGDDRPSGCRRLNVVWGASSARKRWVGPGRSGSGS